MERNHSNPAPVSSGVPHGLMVGPAVFLVYISDLPDHVASQVHLFADNTIIYRTIHGPENENTLQNDLKSLELWEHEWLMEFHPGKCNTIYFNRSQTKASTKYQQHNQHLNEVKITTT